MYSLCQNPQFMQFLQNDLDISDAELQVISRHREVDSAPIPMLLWQYGLISIHQLDQIFDWLENAPQPG